jgi:hypothetical protein
MLFLVLHWWCVENPLPGNFFDQSHHPMRKWLFGDLGALCAFGIGSYTINLLLDSVTFISCNCSSISIQLQYFSLSFTHITVISYIYSYTNSSCPLKILLS